MPLAASSEMRRTEFRIQQAVRAMRAGSVIAYPTEAVWGLGCDPNQAAAVQDLLQMKVRDWRKGVILIAASIEQCEPYLSEVTPEQRALMAASWPGPNTWLVPNNGAASDWITGGQATLALRVSAHPLVQALCTAFGGPIVSTSCNRAGEEPARSKREVIQYFHRQLGCIVTGELGGQKNPTRIRNVVTGEVCRPS